MLYTVTLMLYTVTYNVVLMLYNDVLMLYTVSFSHSVLLSCMFTPVMCSIVQSKPFAKKGK
jgi:hypothetical protein